jgi:predicted permease
MIAEALVPVFFVMFLGYLAGARRIVDNRHVASLNVLVMTFAFLFRIIHGLVGPRLVADF